MTLPFRGINQILKKLHTGAFCSTVRHVVFSSATAKKPRKIVTSRCSFVTPEDFGTRERSKMADKFTEFAGRMGKAPKGVGTGLKLLAAAAAVAYGVKESVYTGIRTVTSCKI